MIQFCSKKLTVLTNWSTLYSLETNNNKVESVKQTELKANHFQQFFWFAFFWRLLIKFFLRTTNIFCSISKKLKVTAEISQTLLLGSVTYILVISEIFPKNQIFAQKCLWEFTFIGFSSMSLKRCSVRCKQISNKKGQLSGKKRKKNALKWNFKTNRKTRSTEKLFWSVKMSRNCC